MTPLRAPKGMNDILPAESGAWHHVESIFRSTMGLYGYREVRTPYLETTPLFVRAIGEVTDVVEKEMYSFVHRDDALTLRPEGTAGVARAYIEHRVHNSEPVSRWFYLGPMFRAERPQRGRYRQFYQAGAELFGDPGPHCDAEMIESLVRFLGNLGISDSEVVINSIGGSGARKKYRDALTDFLEPKKHLLSEESQRRLVTNPLRILDSKSPRDEEAVKGAPVILDVLDADDTAHFEGLRRSLDALRMPYRVDPHLVRGLDYYTRTLFEIKGGADKLGAGNTLVGGGRYDNMIAELGGPSVPAIGFAAGVERLLIARSAAEEAPIVSVFVASMGDSAVSCAMTVAQRLRDMSLPCEVDSRGGSLKGQLRRANALGARFAVIVGEAEIASGSVQVKDLAAHSQESVAVDKVAEYLKGKA